jgi:Nucleotide modification associated domain 1
MVKLDPFQAILTEMKELHDKKSQDYGRNGDLFYNIRQSEEFGIPAWVGCLVRANDKMKRLQLASQGSKLANEGVEDSLIDLANYAVIALIEYRRANA